jgi:hypothetical protein
MVARLPAGVNLPGVEALFLLKLTLNNSITPEQEILCGKSNILT